MVYLESGKFDPAAAAAAAATAAAAVAAAVAVAVAAARPRRAPLHKIGAALPSLENFGLFLDVLYVSTFSGVFEHFRPFLDVFPYFVVFPIYGNVHFVALSES